MINPMTGMRSSTADIAMAGLDYVVWRTADEVAKIINRDRQRTLNMLRACRAEGKPVESQKFSLEGGGFGLKWRKMRAGSVAPIFERQPGWDDVAVTEAMTGYVPTERPMLPDDEPVKLPPFTGGGGEFGGAGASGSWDTPSAPAPESPSFDSSDSSSSFDSPSFSPDP